MLKKERGITLIALVITIIVLLILAGVSISLVIGENGVLNKATESTVQTAIAEEEETVKMAVTVAYMDGEVNKENLDLELNNKPGVGKYSSEEILDSEGNDAIAVTFTDSNRTYFVKANGTISDKDLDFITPTRSDIFEIDEATSTVTMKWDKSENHDGIGFYYNEEGEKILPEEHIVIPQKVNGVEVKIIKGRYWEYNIDSGAFVNASNLKSVVIPNNVKIIESEAFYNCVNLEKVTLSNNLKTIEWGAFRFCESLKEIFIPKSVTNIEDYVFEGCTNLTKIIIEEGSTLTVPDNKWGATNAEIVYQ